MQVTASTFTGNSSYYGAIINDTDYGLVLTRDDITGNSGVYGGGVYNDKSTLTVNGSMIDFNLATDDKGVVYNCKVRQRRPRKLIHGWVRLMNCVDAQAAGLIWTSVKAGDLLQAADSASPGVNLVT